MTALARLARWLGPWTPETRRPLGGRRRRTRVTGTTPFDAWVYRPRGAPSGALLVLPGLHYLGPADPRLDRFLAILADAGLLVMCPFLPEFRRLRVGPSLVPDARAAFDALLAEPDAPRVRPGVFSISFGSYPAIHLASSDARVGALTLFGGYASFEDAIRFSLEGDADQPHDPLNRPIVFLNLVDHLGVAPNDEAPLRAAWMTYVRRTWGRPIMKERSRWEPLARSMAERLPEEARRLFLIGTGAEPGGTEIVKAGLERAHDELSHLDPLDACGSIRCPVTIVHGRDDDVIPHTHAHMLAEAMPASVPTRVLITGLYAHTGHGAPSPSELRDEAKTLGAILETIVDGATRHAR